MNWTSQVRVIRYSCASVSCVDPVVVTVATAAGMGWPAESRQIGERVLL